MPADNTPKKIVIVGAGQAGLQLAIGLRRAGIDVVLISQRGPSEVREGWITSSQLMFATSLSIERSLGLNFWDDVCRPYVDIELFIGGTGARDIAWLGRFNPAARSIDQRVKFSKWLDHFEELGGKLLIKAAGIDDLERESAQSDLTIVASGAGHLSQLFERDDERSDMPKPMRNTTMIYVSEIDFPPGAPPGGLVIVPDVGELVWLPAFSITGPCHIVGFGAVFDGPLDVFQKGDDEQKSLQLAKDVLQRFAPWHSQSWQRMQLTDSRAVMTGVVVPTVRRPVGYLPSGRPVLGLGDAVILNDPIAAQGANDASKAAEHYLRNILKHDKTSFNAKWMLAMFEDYWRDARWSVELSNMLLRPIPDHVRDLFAAAEGNIEIRQTIMKAYDQPRILFPWLLNASATREFMAKFS
jgi:2-polyprenyl-6-methoxyphenol hydroxylase-like FAD-dependent oxidoreductase